MAQDRFLIAPIQTGLQNDISPWLIPDDAFAKLENAYLYKGRVRKRFGSRLMSRNVDSDVAQLTSRLRIIIGTGNGAIDMDTTTSGDLSDIPLAIGQMFSAGDTIWTVNALGAGVATLTTVGGETCTIDSTVSPQTVTIAGIAGGTDVYFYPNLPVMGLLTYDRANTNDELLIAFDTRRSYQYTSNAWAVIGTAAWTGDDSNFFWGSNYRGSNAYDYLLFVSNYVSADTIRYYNGSTWTTMGPLTLGGGATLLTAKIVVPFKDRLLAMNTIESTGTYRNRVRFSQNGDPTTALTDWDETVPGKGGYLDAPTKESIISAEFLKDRLIVYFERSTWELVYTGNEVLPFRWQKINTELGAEGTFSKVPFDKVVLGVGNVGIHACNGANVERIDQKIDEEVFAISNQDSGPDRVHGIRDYKVEQVYWSFPSINQQDDATAATFQYPDKVLVYDYLTGSWAINDDSITTFGYWQDDESATWQSTNDTWEQWEGRWGDGALQARYRYIVAGNQQGYVFIIDPSNGRLAPNLQVTDVNTTTNVITVIEHNLKPGDYILLENMGGLTLDTDIYKVQSVANTTVTINATITGTYTGGGTITRVPQLDILTKRYNFYTKSGRNTEVSKVDFLVDTTQNGQVTLDYYVSSSEVSMVDESSASTGTDSIVGTNILETSPYTNVPFEAAQEQVWHPVYFQAEGPFIQLHIYMTDTQLADLNIIQSDFQLHGMMFHARPTSARLQ